jgi:hypothetical protein
MTQYAALFNDRGLTGVYAVFRLGQKIWNGTSFVVYNHGDDSTYKNTMTDPNNEGYYTVAFPSAVTSTGSYPFTVYVQVGGSPDLTIDTQLGSGNIEIPSVTTTIPVTVPALISKLRILANDYDDSNKIYFEGGSSPGLPDSSRVLFKLQNSNITVGSVYASYSTTTRIQSGFIVNYQDGIVTFSSAPAAGCGLTFDYTYQWFTDVDYQEMLNEASDILVYDTPANVPAGLLPSLMQFGLYEYFIKAASSYARRFASSGGIASEQVSTVTGEFQKLAGIAYKNGCSLRDNFYTRAGRQKAPAFGQTRVFVDPFTPRR